MTNITDKWFRLLKDIPLNEQANTEQLVQTFKAAYKKKTGDDYKDEKWLQQYAEKNPKGLAGEIERMGGAVGAEPTAVGKPDQKKTQDRSILGLARQAAAKKAQAAAAAPGGAAEYTGKQLFGASARDPNAKYTKVDGKFFVDGEPATSRQARQLAKRWPAGGAGKAPIDAKRKTCKSGFVYDKRLRDCVPFKLDPNAVPGNIPDDLWAETVESFMKHKDRVTNPENIVVIDYRKSANSKRMWIVNVKSGNISLNRGVSHGKHSGPAGGAPTKFSNTPRSEQTSLGAYVTGRIYSSAAGKLGCKTKIPRGVDCPKGQEKRGRAAKMHGLDPTNNNANKRHILIHAAGYAPSGRSWGCFATTPSVNERVLDALGTGGFLYAGPVSLQAPKAVAESKKSDLKESIKVKISEKKTLTEEWWYERRDIDNIAYNKNLGKKYRNMKHVKSGPPFNCNPPSKLAGGIKPTKGSKC